MTGGEAIKLVKEVTGMSLDWDDAHHEALQMAITALEQESVLDKIRAEIVDLGQRTMNDNRASGILACRDIIDKYKAEMERQIEIHKGDVRMNITHDYYMVVKVLKRNYRVMYLDGSFKWLSNSDIMTDEPADITMKQFLEIVMEKVR